MILNFLSAPLTFFFHLFLEIISEGNSKPIPLVSKHWKEVNSTCLLTMTMYF